MWLHHQEIRVSFYPSTQTEMEKTEINKQEAETFLTDTACEGKNFLLCAARVKNSSISSFLRKLLTFHLC